MQANGSKSCYMYVDTDPATGGGRIDSVHRYQEVTFDGTDNDQLFKLAAK
jgi:hypothetical protein